MAFITQTPEIASLYWQTSSHPAIGWATEFYEYGDRYARSMMNNTGRENALNLKILYL
jgi:hypothetical protein